ncbi:formimidoylglutamase [Leadbetterella byssophila]|uniref:formimidoylglutamase n=1 Tax=Leadbetterella byssophila TaxID=316068 RepID=UPI00399F198A
MISFKGIDTSQIVKRSGERRIGETLSPEGSFVILGIPESIGVRANYGIGGTETAWNSFINAFLNLQENRFLSGKNICIKGAFEIDQHRDWSVDQLRMAVTHIDEALAIQVKEIFAAGKIPIVIGGGHNNAYPLLKSAFSVFQKKTNVINLDAHADFRHLEGRHSGNAFSYAAKEGYLGKYSVVGLKKEYAPEYMLHSLEKHGAELHFLDELPDFRTFDRVIQKVLQEYSGEKYGVELDVDVLAHVLSSAMTAHGLPIPWACHYLRLTAPNALYLHICEGATELYDGRTSPETGKVLAELVSSFIQGFVH